MYHIITYIEFSELCGGEPAKFFIEKIEDYFASIYKIPDGRFVLQPSMHREVVLFDKYEEIWETINSIGIPIDLYDPGAKYKEQLKNIYNNVDFFVNILSEILNTKLTYDVTVEYLNELSVVLTKYARKKLDREKKDTFYICLGIYLGEIARRILHLNWVAERRIAINPFWIPQLHDKDNIPRCGMIWQIEKDFREMGKINLNAILFYIGCSIKNAEK